ncbi:DNA polymerase delta small subunit Cdc1 [Gurleya vavrai]
MQHILPQLKQKYKGTLFIISDNKPSIFDELKYLKVERPDHYYNKAVKYVLEDLHSRRDIEIDDELLNKYFLTTGMVLGFDGEESEKNVLKIKKIYYPGYITDLKRIKKIEKSYKVAFFSSICVDKEKNEEILHLLIDFIITNKEINEIIIFGNLFISNENELCNIKVLNDLINSLKIKITLVPCIKDPTLELFPLESFPKRIFNANNLQNPVITKINNLNFILTSGENIKDMLRYLPTEKIEYNADDYFDAMDASLKCQHVCVTSPDTLKSVPCDNFDSLLIQDEIDFYVCGNCNEFKIKKVNNDRCTLICLPRFSKNFEFVVFDLIDQTHEIISFA